MSTPNVYLDFEFHDSEEPSPELVCSAYLLNERMHERWLYADKRAISQLADEFWKLRKSHTFVSFGVGAEARSFIALGLDPLDFKWTDLYLEWIAIRNCNGKYKFGTFVKNGEIVDGTPPKRRDDKVSGMSGLGLVDALAVMCRVVVDSKRKDELRRRILQGGPYSLEWREDILKYCAEDVQYLPQLHDALMEAQPFEYGASWNNPVKMQPVPREKATAIRGRWAADLAVIESEGMPLNMDLLWRVSGKVGEIQEQAIIECNEVYPFFERTGKGARAKWVQKYDAFARWVEDNGYGEKWPTTEKGKYKTDEDTLDFYRGHKAIETLRQTAKTLDQVNWFRPEGMLRFLGNVGSDDRIRPFFNPYGTKTGRNAPPARSFPLAMAAWARALISPPEGWEITGFDYGSQEFAIGAVLSGDRNMIQAYNSGDPYIWFAVEARAAPQGATKKSHPDVRDAFKGTCLVEGTPVRVRGKGFKWIEDVTDGEEVWDGEAWRRCQGAHCTGIRKVIYLDGLLCTPEHRFWVGGRWQEAQAIDRRAWSSSKKDGFGMARAEATWADVWAMANCVTNTLVSKKFSLRSCGRWVQAKTRLLGKFAHREVSRVWKCPSYGCQRLPAPTETVGANNEEVFR